MWDLIVSVPDHCLSFYFAIHLVSVLLAKQGPRRIRYSLGQCTARQTMIESGPEDLGH